MLRVYLLGRIELESDGRRWPEPQGQPAKALLAVLALRPGIRDREIIAEELWPGYDASSQRQSLRSALRNLRRTFRPAALEKYLASTKTQLGLRDHQLCVDVVEVRDLVEVGKDEDALRLLRGELAPGVKMDWIEPLRDDQRAFEAELLERLADRAAARGDHRLAVELARRQVGLDPLDVGARRALMHQLMGAGKLRAALVEHDRLERSYARRHLSYERSPEMRHLLAKLRSRVRVGEQAAGAPRRRRAGMSRHDTVEDAMSSYRWDSLVAPAPPNDPSPEFAMQAIRIAYRRSVLPETLRVACVAVEDDNALNEMSVEDGYWFRWLIDASLDPSDARNFAVHSLMVDGRPLDRLDDAPLSLSQGPTVEYSFRVPDSIRDGQMRSLDLMAHARLFVADERRPRAETLIFTQATDAEFRLSVVAGLAVRRITVGTTQITPLEPGSRGISGATWGPMPGAVSALARFPFPLQAGSGVTFELDRTPGDLGDER